MMRIRKWWHLPLVDVVVRPLLVVSVFLFSGSSRKMVEEAESTSSMLGKDF